MRTTLTIIFFLGAFIYYTSHRDKYTTYVQFKQTYASGFSDSATAVIDTKDSAIFSILYHSPERQFPTGAYFICCKSADVRANRFYLNPSVIRVTPYRVFSVKK
jgi:hypothetical protein